LQRCIRRSEVWNDEQKYYVSYTKVHKLVKSLAER
jgi:hypothetical protein